MESMESLISENIGWLRGWLEARLSGYRRQDVDDICQEIFLKAVRGIGRLRDQKKFPAWLYKIANNKLNDYLRQQKRRIGREVSASDVDLADSKDVPREIDLREEARRALQAVLQLPVRYREPMVLRHLEELSYDEIGRILGISKSNVQVRIFRARQMLRQATRVDSSTESAEPSKGPVGSSGEFPEAEASSPARNKRGLGDFPASVEKIGIL